MYPENDYTYSALDTVYAWFSLLMAFLFCQVIPVEENPLGALLLILALFAAGFGILKLKKLKPDATCIISAVSSLVIGSALLLTDTQFLRNLSLAYCLGSYLYFLYAALGNRIEQGFSNYIYIDFIKVLMIPFVSLRTIFSALFNRSAATFWQILRKVIVGLCITVVPTAVIFLLLSYDHEFSMMLDNMFSFDIGDIGPVIGDLLWTIPLAMYGFGLYISSQRKVLQESMSAERCQEGLQKAKILPQLTALVAVLPIVFLYGVFFVIQWQYYVSGFAGVLPAELGYAQYARQGFFELCTVSVINLLIIIAISFFIKQGNNGSSIILKIVATVFCLCTLVLISTAVAKLVMYIDCYGLTQKRIYAMWLMALIGIVFLVIALGQFFRKIKVVAVCFCLAVVMFAGLSVCNVNAMCARYNADRYLAGDLDSLDIIAMRELGDSAVPSLVRIATSMDAEKDPQLKQDIDTFLRYKKAQFEEDASVFSFSIPSALAKSALENYTPE